MARTLSFQATRIETELEETTSLSFVVESDGDPSVFFTMIAEDEEAAEVRVSWGDGKDSREECVLSLASAMLAPGRFKAAFADPRPAAMGPYGAVEVAFEELDEDDARGAAVALSALGKALGPRLTITVPGVGPGLGPKMPDLPRRHGAPVLGVVSKSTWATGTGQSLTLALTVSNGGGALDGGIVVELGGAALEKGHVEPRTASVAGGEASFERKGMVAVARLPGVRIPADLEIDRKVDKKAPRSPSIPLEVVVEGQKPGAGLFTVRVLVAARGDRTGSAMVGRTLVVGS